MSIETAKILFQDMLVLKNATRKLFSDVNIPSYIRDWFVKRNTKDDGSVDLDDLQQKIKAIIPPRNAWNDLLSQILEGKQVRLLARVMINIDITNESVNFALPDYDLPFSKTIIPDDVWRSQKEQMLHSHGAVWGVVDLNKTTIQIGKKIEVRVGMSQFTGFKPYKVDIAYYQAVRAKLKTAEWIDLLLGAIDYNAEGFSTELEKLSMLHRLLPFLEKRINMIELAPKGTGKSYLFSQISKWGWLSTGGVMTRAKLFYDMQRREHGLLSHYDFVALDEIGTTVFQNETELQGAMKGYLESGTYSVGVASGKSDAGLILLGNIPIQDMNAEQWMLQSLPSILKDSALLDRFHGFIEGWNIPRMQERLKQNDWAISSEYISEIFHLMRDSMVYAQVVESMLDIPSESDTRDVTAVKRLTTAFVKLLFPHWIKSELVDKEEFIKYCLHPALRMRSIIKRQMAIIDPQFALIPALRVDVRS